MENCNLNSSTYNHDENGNVLFLILIAVVLFAALSFAVTQSSRSGNPDMRDKADLIASRFAQYGASISTAVMRVRIGNACKDNELNFENPVLQHPDFWGGSTNTTAPVDGRCNIFGAKGGGAVYWAANKELPVPDKVYDILNFTGVVGVKDVGTEATDLIMYLVLDSSEQSKKICTAFNERMGNVGDTRAGTTRTLDWAYAAGAGIEYSATEPVGPMTIGEDPVPSALKGKQAGCLMGSSSHDSDNNILYYVLLAR